MGNLVIGILAHVDAGKTTLAEGMLYLSGGIKSLGRVDHKNAFLDMHEMERNRGITIYSKQAKLHMGERDFTLVDTPGHVDFSTEMERTLRILDYAIVVISGADGVQGHVQTLWKLLERYEVPTFIFLNKMDQEGIEKQELLKELKERLSSSCVEFIEHNGELQIEVMEEIATSSEDLLQTYLENETLQVEDIQCAIRNRHIFPCYLGSALKLEGVQDFMEGMGRYVREEEYPREFGGIVYKILRDEQGTRLSYVKVTGGELRIKDKVITARNLDGTVQEEKVEQIRIDSGVKHEKVQSVTAGDVCAIMGLQHTKAGQGIGSIQDERSPMLEPILTYQMGIPPEVSPHALYLQLQELQEEQPCLGLTWNSDLEEIQVSVMGEIQVEVLKNLIQQRYQVTVDFLEEKIVYKETVNETVVGIGHYEPLKHYAEVHIRIEKGESGTGVIIKSECSEEVLSKNRQNLVCTHLKERLHKGVLVGGEITDVILTVIAGREHAKHTEGGDFREATYRAVRQGLLYAECELLEPIYEFYLEVPQGYVGRALYDIQQMFGTIELHETNETTSVIRGTAPLSTMRGYQRSVADYTKGMGIFDCHWKGYGPCHNAEEIIGSKEYNPHEDLYHSGNSIFCANGVGYTVPWDEVYEKSHVSHTYGKVKKEERVRTQSNRRASDFVTNDEIDIIFQNLYRRGSGKPKYVSEKKIITAHETEYRSKNTIVQKKEEYLLVDGYNIIFAWKELKELADITFDGARERLIEIMSNYNGYRGIIIIIVFDAYKVKGNIGSIEVRHNVHVVYTKEAETADAYIERTVHELRGQYAITVATSDGMEQLIVMGQGALRMSANNLLEEVNRVSGELREHFGIQEES